MNILITGGASGLGTAITECLCRNNNHKVYITYNKSEKKAKELESLFPNLKTLHCDFEKEHSIAGLLNKIDEYGIEVLINNAFTGLQTNYFHKMDPEYFIENFRKNILPVIKITQACILRFRKQKQGKIITILSSYIINKPPIGMSEYVAEKNYLLSLSKSWAVENAKFNITSNCISPSTLQTGLTQDTDERIIEEMINSHPLKKMLSLEEVAQTVEYFVSASQQVNGTNFIINAASDLI